MRLNADLNINAQQLALASWYWGSDYYAGRFNMVDMPKKSADLNIRLLECNDFMLPPPRFSRLRQPLFRLLPNRPIEMWRYSRATLHTLRRTIETHNQQCVCWTMNTDFTSSGLGSMSQRLYWRWGIAAAKILDAPRLRVILGGADDAPPNSELDRRVIERLLAFADYCWHQIPSLTIVVENHWGISSDIGRLMAILAAVREQLPADRRTQFGLCLDPANVALAQRAAAWEQMVPHAIHVHLKRRDDDGNPIALDQLITMLDAVEYTGIYTIEVE